MTLSEPGPTLTQPVRTPALYLPRPIGGTGLSGVMFRGYRGAADIQAVAGVRAAQEAFDGDIDDSVDERSLATQFAHPLGWDPASDVTIAEVDGHVVAWGRIEHQAFADEDAFRSRGYVLPAVRGLGLGTAMLASHEARLVAKGAGVPMGRPRWFHGWVTDNMPRAAALFCRAGYAPFHYYLEMERAAEASLPSLSQLAEGIALEAPGRADLPEFARVLTAAFAGQWGTRSLSDADREAIIVGWLADPGQDPSLWRVARTDGRIVAALLVSNDTTTGIGMVDSLGTLPEARGLGIGSALLASAVEALRVRGAAQIVLSVDTENDGALGLYERFGFTVRKRGIGYRKPFPA